MKKPKLEEYPFEMSPLSPDEGGGFLITFPDLPGCMADGETLEEALAEGRNAFACWMAAQIEDGRPIPEPSKDAAPGRFVQRLPKSLHARLVARAKQEGVSMNTLVVSIIADSLGRRDASLGLKMAQIPQLPVLGPVKPSQYKTAIGPKVQKVKKRKQSKTDLDRRPNASRQGR